MDREGVKRERGTQMHSRIGNENFNRDKAIITVGQAGIQKPEDQNGQYKITRQEEGEREHGKQGRYQEVR